jgi:hypothetical protein
MGAEVEAAAGTKTLGCMSRRIDDTKKPPGNTLLA